MCNDSFIKLSTNSKKTILKQSSALKLRTSAVCQCNASGRRYSII